MHEDLLGDLTAGLRLEHPDVDAAQVSEVVGFWWRMLGTDAGTAEEVARRAGDTLRLRQELTGPQPSDVEWAEEVQGDLDLAMARLDELVAAGWLVLSVTALTPDRDRWRLLLAAPL